MLQRIREALFRPVDVASLVAFRIAFGLLMSGEAIALLEHGYSEAWLERRFLFTWPGFHWVAPLPGAGAHLHLYVLSLLGLLIAVGACYRLACALFCAGFTWLLLIDQTDYLNHSYLICLVSFLLVFLPAHRQLSVDAWLRPSLRSEWIPAWPVWALRAQMGVVYLFGGIAKLEPDWLRGMPTGIWASGRVELPLLAPLADGRAFALAIAWGGLVFDLCIVPALLWRRTRPFAFAAALAFHGLNSRIFHIGVFPWLAIAATLVFFDPDWPRRVFRWPRRSAEPEGAAWSGSEGTRRAVTIGLALWFAVQVLLPWRHWIYPGRAIWTEQGQTFAWRMMLREKLGIAVFKLEDPETGRAWIVDPADELSDAQTGQLALYPRRLQQYARHLADTAEAAGQPRPRVQAMTLVSLNGRPAVPIVDPTVDLAAEPPRVFSHAPWILDLEDRRFATDPTWQEIADGLMERFGENAWKR